MYTPDMQVPPLVMTKKHELATALYKIFHECPPETQRIAIRNLLRGRSDEEKAYAQFWWERERDNPNWRYDDPNQGRPHKAHLSIVR